MIRTNTIQALLNEHPRLHNLGYGSPPGKQMSDGAPGDLLTPAARGRIYIALSWIEANLVPATRVRTPALSTYHWKHRMQRANGVYVSNGQFTAAALLSSVSVDTRYYNPLLLAVTITPKGSRA